jgi:hypothetical protein
MSFADIDGQKVGVIFIVIEELNDVTNLATEGRSGKTSEDQYQRFTAGALANMKSVSPV